VSDGTAGEPTLGEAYWRGYIAKASIVNFPYTDLTDDVRRAIEAGAAAAGAAAIARLNQRSLDGLMPMGLSFSDADPISHCLVGECRWHGHGDSMTDAVTAWTKHLAETHRHDWPED
jgi:hypothetical protein